MTLIQNRGKANLIIFFGLALLSVANFSCSKEEPAKAPVPVTGNKKALDPNDPFQAKYSSVNSFAGKWKVTSYETQRTDEAADFFKKLVNETAVTMTVPDAVKSKTNDEFTIRFPEAGAARACNVTFEVAGSYCCFSMMRMTFVAKDFRTNPPREDNVGCSLSHTGKTPEDLYAAFMQGLVGSPTSPMPAIYHFNHNETQDKLRLQNPAPEKKSEAIEDLETTILFDKE